ncbi:MAG TPA: copper resistance CopC family protein [Methylomirabilota bacterium]|nr:copper resistance CopC family protein [Methylomirabilota bacterium]
MPPVLRLAVRARARSVAGRRGFAPIALGVGLLLVPASGLGHASLVRSSPARRAVLLRAPDRVQLWFNERLEPAFSRVGVFDAAGQPVDLGDVQVGPDDPTRLSVRLRRLAPGTYTVRFRVLSVDGHVVESEFPFTLRAP